ncbi:putative DNA polymerase III, delta subunit [Nitrospira sp. KM1]|uniref:DNA polymerase III subunit delta n=1 Tax=Nitrospira sp. KM1 TaxID=1936990 RepID=UPI0013A72C00|nr:DNA polymerase III subunit delta [Nitrospira sp. KM1]BCA55110.1 putative DNA polymerase III, delta subunit [Nitrospira sp. KM1]
MPTSLTPAQLDQQLEQGHVAPVYVVLGEEDLLRDHAVAALKRVVLGSGADEFNCDIFYGDEAEGAQIVTCANEVAVFAPRRVIIVKSAEKLPSRQADTLLPYLKEPNPSTVFVLVAAKLDGRLKWTQTLVKAGVVIDCSPLREPQLTQWFAQEAGRAGIELTDGAVQILKEGCGGSLTMAKRELEKLSAFMPAGRAVTGEDVETIRGTEPGASVFDLAAAIGSKNRGRALTILARNLDAGEAPLRMLGSLVWQYRRLWKVKELVRQGGREGEAARTLRMDPYKVRTFLGQFSDTDLQEAFRSFLAADNDLKGGSSTKPAMILDMLVLKLCGGQNDGERSFPERTGKSVQPGRGKTLSNVRTISVARSKN